MDKAKFSFEKYKHRILKPGQKFDFDSHQFTSKDNFFMEEDEGEERAEEEEPVRRLEVDKRGNVIKKSKVF